MVDRAYSAVPFEGLCPYCLNSTTTNGRCPRCGKSAQTEQRDPNALPLGYILQGTYASYQIGGVLGAGGFGITYLAWATNAHRRVAIKELFPVNYVMRNYDGSVQVERQESMPFFLHVKQRFGEEARLLYNLRAHKEILNVFDFFEANGTAYYAMEYLEGNTLARELHRNGRALSWQQLEKPVTDLLKTLAILHANGLLHRDISPDNIMLCTNGTTKLIDFGSVRSQEAEHFTTFLKENFSAPEMLCAQDREAPCTDLYSVCATLYYLLSGGRNPTKAFARVNQQKQLTPLGTLAPDVPTYVQNAIHKGLNLAMDERFQSVAELEEALQLQVTPVQQPQRERRAPQPMPRPMPRPERKVGLFKRLWQRLRAKKRSKEGLLVCVKGHFRGYQTELIPDVEIFLGRGTTNGKSPEGAAIIYPNDRRVSQGISRTHCMFKMDARGRFYVKDMNSSFGTYVDGERLAPGNWRRVQAGEQIAFGRETYVFMNKR